MTSQEMSREFNIIFESVASMAAPGYTEYEKSVLLTQAQEEVTIETAQKAMDSNDFARTVLEKLITRYSTPTVAEDFDVIKSTTTNRVYKMTLPASPQPQFFYPYIEFACTGTGTTYYERVCKPVDYDSYYTSIANPYANPYKDLYWRLYDNGYLIIVTDGTALATPYIKGLYIKKPTPIITENLTGGKTIDNSATATDSCLHEVVHREIVNRAAMKAYAAIRDQVGLQLKSIEQKE